MKRWIYVMCYEDENKDPAFIHTFVEADWDVEAYDAGYAWFRAQPNKPKGRLINDYVAELP
jgi:hypothetical protein